MTWLAVIGMLVGGAVGILFGVFLLYILSDENRTHEAKAFLAKALDNRFTQWAIDRTVGPAMHRADIETHIDKGNYDRATQIALREGLVDDTLEILCQKGRLREAALIARKTGREDDADDLYRLAIRRHDERGEAVYAAEIAEEAGFFEEAVDRFAGLDSAVNRTRAARIAADQGWTERALRLYMEDENLLDAMRVAEQAGQIEFLIDFSDKSNVRALHIFAAEAASRAGDPDRGLAILEQHGYLHQAVLFAKERGLMDRVTEFQEKIAARNREESEKRQQEGFGHYPGGTPLR